MAKGKKNTKEKRENTITIKGYSLGELAALDVNDFSKYQSCNTHQVRKYFFYEKVGTKMSPYSEKLATYHDELVELPVNDWVEVSKFDYDRYKKYLDTPSEHYYSSKADYYEKRNVEDAKTEMVKYNNNIIEDLSFLEEKIEDNPSVTDYTQLVSLRLQMADIAFQYMTQLYELYDEYDVAFLEEKASYFVKVLGESNSEAEKFKKKKAALKAKQYRAAKKKKKEELTEKISKLEKELKDI